MIRGYDLYKIFKLNFAPQQQYIYIENENSAFSKFLFKNKFSIPIVIFWYTVVIKLFAAALCHEKGILKF
jgi:hypothetical protein